MSEFIKPFKQAFLSNFFIAPDRLTINESILKKADDNLTIYERTEIDRHLEKTLRRRNDLLTSFAVSKAENSALTLIEATEVYDLLEKNSLARYPAFIAKKIKAKEKLKQNDHDRLEYYNIAKTFKSLEKDGIELKRLSPQLILNLHKQLTKDLDIFKGQINGFEIYDSGHFRDNDKIRVGDYQPAPHKEIELSVKELIGWLKKNPTAINIFIFHTALYALHPFKNGNKRVCRVLEHFLLQDIGYNQKNLYSLSYYYHKHRNDYYNNLIEALHKRNLNYFVSFACEAMFFSITSVVNGVLQRKRVAYLEASGLDKSIIRTLKPLTKYRELKFGRFYALAKRKSARQTFVNYLKEATERGVIKKRELGKNTFYSLAGNYPEEQLLNDWLLYIRDKVNQLPEEFARHL